MYLIATDEAGYGPKLGPLIIAATLWRVPGDSTSQTDLDKQFAPLRNPISVHGKNYQIDDSKKIYRSSSGVESLECLVGAGLRWCGLSRQDLSKLIESVSPDDVSDIKTTPWLTPWADSTASRITPPTFPPPTTHTAANHSGDGSLTDSVNAEIETALQQYWSKNGLTLVDVKMRMITARRFNQICSGGFNKSDLLSRYTINLIANLNESIKDQEKVAVFCDRHGGRKFYAGPLQHRFENSLVRVVSETKQESCYQFEDHGRQLNVRFTVKGDRFPPVAYSSIFAKYLRERMMERLNDYFSSRSDEKIRPTAGYPVDASRFLNQIAPIRMKENIDDANLIRNC